MRCRISMGAVCAVLGFSATGNAAPMLKDALDGAWAKHPLALSAGARIDEGAAKRESAASWLADAPRISAGQKTDRWNQNAGAREWEAELAVALQLPALRAARSALAESESASRDAQANAERWRLAGEVRESYWQARLAASEQMLADRKVADAQALSRDVERRFKAGEVARTDWNQAQAAFKLAESAAADARAKAYRAERGFFGVTGLSQMPEDDEMERGIGMLEQHPQVRELMREAETARARQQETLASRRDPPEISLGTVRERASHGESSAGSVVLRLTVPLDAGARYRARQAAAGAERIEAEARIAQLRARLEADIASAREEVAQSVRQVEFAEARLALCLETHALLDKAYRLGELDLPARLRAQADRFDAEISLARARLERARNISRFNQASGIFP